MRKGNLGFENKGLVVLLGMLGVVIVGLAVGIAIVSMNKGEEVVINDENEDEISYQEYLDYVEEYDIVQTEADRLLNEDPVDITAVVNLYSKYIDENLANNEIDRASSYMYAEYESLLASGFKEELLSVMTARDYGVFDEPEQYRWFIKIIDLGRELGRDDVVVEYEPLATKTRAAYDANYAAAEAAAEEFDLTSDSEEDEK